MKPTVFSFMILTGLSLFSGLLSAEILTDKVSTNRERIPKPPAARNLVEDIDWKTIEDKLVARGGMLYTYWSTLRTKAGKVYTQVEVKSANSVGITISHRDGFNDIDYADLSPELQSKFMYDPQEAKDFKAGKPLPYLHSDRKRAVEDRISLLLSKKHDDEVAEAENKVEARRLANEQRMKAKQAWSDARETLLQLEQGFYRSKGNNSIKVGMLQQQKLVAKYLDLYQKAQANYDAIPSPLLR